MKINKYLKELGLTWYDLPGNYIPKKSLKMRLKRKLYKIKSKICYTFPFFEKFTSNYKEEYEYPAYTRVNKEDNEGFCPYEFYSLDYSLALYIYPRLCKFRDDYGHLATPSSFCFDENGKQKDKGNEEWIKTLDKMILAFKYIIKEPENIDFKKCEEIIDEGLTLFSKYYFCLWY